MNDAVMSGFREYQPHAKDAWDAMADHAKAQWSQFLVEWRRDCKASESAKAPILSSSDRVALHVRNQPHGSRPFTALEDSFVIEKAPIWTAKQIALVLKREPENVQQHISWLRRSGRL